MAVSDFGIQTRLRASHRAYQWTQLDAALIVLGAIALLGLVRATIAITVPYPSATEGWNAYHTAAAMAGLGPYPPASSLMVNNYPPLSFYLVGVPGWLIGDYVLAGRLISLASFLVIILELKLAAKAMGCSAKHAGFASLTVAVYLLFDTAYVGINAPQFLGQAIQFGALLLLIAAPRRGTRLVLAAALMVLALFIKHNLVALPLAVGLWLAIVDRRASMVFIASGVLFMLAGVGLFQILVHRSLWEILNQPRIWSLGLALNGFGGRVPEFILPLMGTGLLLHRARGRHVWFAAGYTVVALAFGFWFLGGAGCSGNVVFDVFIAQGWCGALALHHLTGRERHVALACWFVPAIGMIGFHAAADNFKPRYWLSPNAPQVTNIGRDVAFLKAADGPVLAADLTMLWWAQKPATIDLWSYEQAVATGKRDGHELIDAISQRRYAVLALGSEPNALAASPETPRYYVEAVGRAISANYRVDHRDTTATYWVRR